MLWSCSLAFESCAGVVWWIVLWYSVKAVGFYVVALWMCVVGWMKFTYAHT